MILGCRVDAVGRDAAVERIAELAHGDEPGIVVTLGVEMVMAAQRDAQFRRIINNAALVTCDTIGLLLASRARGGPLRERVTGVELVGALAARSAARGDLRLFLLGGAADTARRAAASLRRQYNGVTVSGLRDGFFTEDESARVAAEIRASGANVLLAGLGSPKQEYWLVRHLAETGCSAGIGVGGSFDVYAGNVQRAPALVQRAGLEWAYRLVTQPRRWRRQLALPRFAVAASREALALRRKGQSE
ncbi:N-acetylmannosaminyltransferase [Vulcanimicrobium alpinum]|uniref:N-acetylmannosaminyltransferase n=1 Tax=Vulcanimicrobium alpinum TaxID=3016050 RepID=A0AAN2C947_UNVUL|nr:WecB/TagA/CpsF family glycosyltransferase [Vulcanimicrobium alpinum]BDE05939.1 N-acetylmannosaminyltransferase [Vulcanimicrobium alpinum]